MALPTPTKTWQFNVNNAQAALGSALLDNRTWILAVKNALIGFGTQPWTVVSSSNSTTANSSDNWTVPTSLVYANNGSIHSWIVLKQTGIGSNAQILISCPNAASGQSVTMRFSPSTGFTGGTTSQDPTAADSFAFATVLTIGPVSDVAVRWSVMMSSDGQCTRIFMYSGGVLFCFIVIDKFGNATGGTPGGTNSGWCSALGSAPTLIGTTVQNAVTAATVISYESVANLGIASEVDGAWDILPLGVTCTATVGARGRLGTLQDLWATSTGIASGDTFPATGSPAAQFINIAGTAFGVVLPWNNGAFNLT